LRHVVVHNTSDETSNITCLQQSNQFGNSQKIVQTATSIRTCEHLWYIPSYIAQNGIPCEMHQFRLQGIWAHLPLPPWRSCLNVAISAAFLPSLISHSTALHVATCTHSHVNFWLSVQIGLQGIGLKAAYPNTHRSLARL
jgi:hypothetical protein